MLSTRTRSKTRLSVQGLSDVVSLLSIVAISLSLAVGDCERRDLVWAGLGALHCSEAVPVVGRSHEQRFVGCLVSVSLKYRRSCSSRRIQLISIAILSSVCDAETSPHPGETLDRRLLGREHRLSPASPVKPR